MRKELTCHHCGTDFVWEQPKGKPALYCSDACRRIAYGRPAIQFSDKVCAKCGRAFPLVPGKNRQRYCAEHAASRGYKSSPRRSAEERYWHHVDIRGPDDCWPWRSAPTGGYGAFWTGEVQTTANRYGLSLKLRKPLSEIGPHTRHSCDNPPCQNPAHLTEGTAADNHEDMRLRGRRKRTGPPGGQLTAEAVVDIRTRYATGDICQQGLADQYGVNQRTISSVVLRKIWRHV